MLKMKELQKKLLSCAGDRFDFCFAISEFELCCTDGIRAMVVKSVSFGHSTPLKKGFRYVFGGKDNLELIEHSECSMNLIDSLNRLLETPAITTLYDIYLPPLKVGKMNNKHFVARLHEGVDFGVTDTAFSKQEGHFFCYEKLSVLGGLVVSAQICGKLCIFKTRQFNYLQMALVK